MLPFLNILPAARKIVDLQAKVISPILLCFSCIIKKPLGALSIVIITARHTCWNEKKALKTIQEYWNSGFRRSYEMSVSMKELMYRE